MTKTEKRALLELLGQDKLKDVFLQLQARTPTEHPDAARINNLARRHRELEERIEMGTLSKEDIIRLSSRIGGGLKDILQEYKPLAEHLEAAPEKGTSKPAFKLNLTPEVQDKKAPEDTPTLGFFGEVTYAGSLTMQQATVTLYKSYGAAYHTCREAVRQAGMQMEKGDRDGGHMEASSAGTGAGSYGEKILVWLSPLDASKTKVQVIVDSQLPTLTFDFGRNKQKLSLLVSYLR